MYDDFTKKAQDALQIACDEAVAYEHEYVGTEHILIGLLQQHSGVAAKVLRSMGVNVEAIRVELDKLLQHGTTFVPLPNKQPLTPRAKRVIDIARQDAAATKHKHVGTGHLLCAILGETGSIAAQILMNMGPKLDSLPEEIEEWLKTDPADNDGEGPPNA